MDLSDFRKEYQRGKLSREDLPAQPLPLFTAWMDEVVAAKYPDPNAMTIATVDANGQPFQRIVLLKGYDENGFLFYTNLGSRKAQHLKENAQISLHFPWYVFERQVHIMGVAEKLSTAEVMKYFITRPHESQLGAWASQQSTVLTGRQMLEKTFFDLKKKYTEGEVPLPDFWGGYRIKPTSFEFWQGGEHRLHDRFLYRDETDGEWTIERLSP